MSEENIDNKESHESKTFDAESFKREIIEQNRAMIASLESKVESLKPVERETYPHVEVKQSYPIDELRDYTTKIGVDEEQLSAIVSLVENLMDKKGKTFEKNILSTVDSNLETRETKNKYTSMTATEYPEILDKSSDLFKLSCTMFGEMTPEMRKAPDAERIATERAALRLGIKPLSIEAIRSQNAHNGAPGSGPSREQKKVREVSEDFARAFGVDPKKVNEHYKRIQSRHKVN